MRWWVPWWHSLQEAWLNPICNEFHPPQRIASPDQRTQFSKVSCRTVDGSSCEKMFAGMWVLTYLFVWMFWKSANRRRSRFQRALDFFSKDALEMYLLLCWFSGMRIRYSHSCCHRIRRIELRRCDGEFRIFQFFRRLNSRVHSSPNSEQNKLSNYKEHSHHINYIRICLINEFVEDKNDCHRNQKFRWCHCALLTQNLILNFLCVGRIFEALTLFSRFDVMS